MKELYSFENCASNALCSSLPSALRESLCARCMKSSFAAGSSIMQATDNLILPLSGICCSEAGGKAAMIYPCGFLVVMPTGNKDSWRYSENSGRATEGNYPEHEQVKFVSVTDSACAVFRESHIQELWSKYEFAMAVRKSWFWGADIMFQYDMNVYRQDAYHAVRHVLQYAKNQGVTYLTHAQIAYLTNLGRSTVTQAMGELMIAEAELFN